MPAKWANWARQGSMQPHLQTSMLYWRSALINGKTQGKSASFSMTSEKLVANLTLPVA